MMYKEMDINYDYINLIIDKIKNKISLSKEEVNYFLSAIIFKVRTIIDNNDDFSYKCDLAQSILYYYLSDLGLICHACNTLSSIDSYVCGHSFLTTSILVDNKITNYLLDPTYLQFFKESECSVDRYVYFNNYVIRTPYPGYFIKDSDKKVIEKFNYDGYAILDDDIARIYGDSFYNTKVMVTDTSFKSIKGFVYINAFMKGNDLLSKSKEEVINEGYYLSFDKKRSVKKG